MFMIKDKRNKCCWNPQCRNHKKHVKFKADDTYCPKCGRELVYACAKCGLMMEDRGRKHKVCDHCAEKKKANKANRKEAAASIYRAIASVGDVITEKIEKRNHDDIDDK